MAKLDWDQASRRERNRLQRQTLPRRQQDREHALRSFVYTHGIGCFKCGSQTNAPAKTGHNKRGPWMICSSCVRSRQR